MKVRCDVCGTEYPIEEMKHYGREQFLEDEAYHCQGCEAKIAEEIRRWEQRPDRYTWPRNWRTP